MPLALAAALMMLLGLQVLMPVQTEVRLASTVMPRRPAQAAGPVAQAYPEVLRRPIFAPDRQMSTVSQPQEGPADGTSAIPAGPAQLVGLAVGQGAASAVVRSPGGRSRVVRVGNVVDGWRIRAVTPRGLILGREGETKLLALAGEEADAEDSEDGQ